MAALLRTPPPPAGDKSTRKAVIEAQATTKMERGKTFLGLSLRAVASRSQQGDKSDCGRSTRGGKGQEDAGHATKKQMRVRLDEGDRLGGYPSAVVGANRIITRSTLFLTRGNA